MAKLTMTWRFERKMSGNHAYVDEKQDGVSGFTRWGPMPLEDTGRFIEDRKKELITSVNRARAALSQPGDGR